MAVLLAVDGGQTGTRALLTRLDGTVLDSAAGEAVAPHELGELIGRLDPASFDVVAVCAGLTSIDAEDSPQAAVAAAAVRACVPGAAIRVVPDRSAALAGATAGEHGIVLLAGGGAIVAGVGPAGCEVVLSGYGFRVGEDGSAVDIGRHAVAAGLRGWEGRGPATVLTDVVATALGIREPRQAVAAISAPSFHRSRLAALAPAVVGAAGAGDAVAAALVGAAAQELASAALAAAERLYEPDERAPVFLTGGLLQTPTALSRLVEEIVLGRRAAATVARVPHASATGAMALAARTAGVFVDGAWLDGARAGVAARLG